MLLRFVVYVGVATMAIIFAEPQRPWAQSPTQTPRVIKPDATPNVAPAPAAKEGGAAPTLGDPFGEDTNLAARPIVYLKGTGTWDKAFETIALSFKTLRSFVDKEGLKQDGPPMTIFTATDDAGFRFEAALPLAVPPKRPPPNDIAIGTSPQGHALKFVHRGSYDALDNTYEAITNFLDERRLEAKDLFIEEYVTDPLSTSEEQLVVNVLVLVK